MIIITYDITDNKLRTNFSKFLQKYGRKLQYSVYEIKNSDRLLNIIETEIKYNFEKRFKQTDSVFIFRMSKTCKITRYGFAKNEEEDLIIV